MEFDYSPILENWRYLLGGFGITLGLSALTVVASLLLGLALAMARLYGPRWLRWPVVFYIDSMRAIPVLVVLVWTFFAMPLLLGISMSTFSAAVIALTAHIAPFVAEIVRSGVESVRPGQTSAGLALGMSRAQVVRHLILPQALVRMMPSFGSVISITIKDTAIAAVIAVPEYMKRSETLAGQTYHPVEIFTFAMLVYFVILFPITRCVDMAYRRWAFLGRS
ncbi:MAG: amino acid ABC transporter permease [Comamonadaceae bacterium]|jgi:polar amino acid transport system permease protein|nr:amino acid ABC transporter permease [Comamonadaceae bacterium]